MPSLQDAFDEALDRLPRIAIDKLVREKLAEAGASDDALADRIAESILAGEMDAATSTVSNPVIEFDDQDFDRIQKALASLIETLPDLVEDVAGKTAQDILHGMQEQWLEGGDGTSQRENLRERILRTWREPFDLTRMLVALCIQQGDEFNQPLLNPRRSEPPLRLQTLARLHIRACRIAEEILLLLENGFTEGAQARWRTMHEVVVSATIIAAGDEALARRYIDHDAVERKKALDDYRRGPGTKPPLPRGLAAAIVDANDRVVKKYGNSFRGMYGWAAGQCGIPEQAKFFDLQEAAGNLSLKHRWRQASFDTHASPGALSQPVHGWDPTTHVAGTFSAGFEEPATDLAQAIVQITGLLFPEPWDLDKVALVKTLCLLRDKVVDAWHRTARKIDKEEQRSLERAARRSGRRRVWLR